MSPPDAAYVVMGTVLLPKFIMARVRKQAEIAVTLINPLCLAKTLNSEQKALDFI